MNRAPYRAPADPITAPAPPDDEEIQTDLFRVVAVVWCVSMVRVVVAARLHQSFALPGDPALAMFVVALIPWLGRDAILTRIRSFMVRAGAFMARRKGE